MRRMFLRAAVLAALLAVPSLHPAAARDYRAGEITISQPWTRAVGERALTAAGYMVLHNTGTTADRLLAASSPLARAVELHQSVNTDGIVRMRPLPDGIALPPGETVRIDPAGLHLMLIGPVGGFKPGAKVPLTLRFERGGEIAVELAVESAGARAAPPAATHQGH